MGAPSPDLRGTSSLPVSRAPHGLPVRGIVYDHDGTLIDSIDLVVAATNATLLGGGFAAESREAVMRAWCCRHSSAWLSRRLRDAALRAELAERYYAEAWRIGASAARPYPGVGELLQAVRDLGLPQAMLSNNQGDFIRHIMKAHGLDAFIDPIWGEEDVEAPKPAAAGLVAIADGWRLAAREVLLVAIALRTRARPARPAVPRWASPGARTPAPISSPRLRSTHRPPRRAAAAPRTPRLNAGSLRSTCGTLASQARDGGLGGLVTGPLAPAISGVSAPFSEHAKKLNPRDL